jgi:predicted HNH restriction endonuclease
VDHIIVMKDGDIQEQGSYSDLMKGKGEFNSLMKAYGGIRDEESEEESTVAFSPTKSKSTDLRNEMEASARIDLVMSKNEKKDARNLTSQEDRAEGAVKGITVAI